MQDEREAKHRAEVEARNGAILAEEAAWKKRKVMSNSSRGSLSVYCRRLSTRPR